MQEQMMEQGAMDTTVSRILAISPEQYETRRRNYSRIYISAKDEAVIDSILLQGQRPIESYSRAVTRAIAEFGLSVPDRELQLRAVFEPKTVGGTIFQQHFATNGWLEDEEQTLFDLVVELETVGEQLNDPDNLVSFNGNQVEGAEFENPICFKIGIEDLVPAMWGSDEDSQVDDNQDQQTTQAPRHEPEVQQRGGTPGRVTNPETDRRLKQNRERPEQLVSARAAQDRDSDTGSDASGRMAGKPGRIKNPLLDGRLKHNRRQAVSADAGGR